MEKWVIPLEWAGTQELSLVGAKAAALGSLLEAGFPVPPGFCLTALAFSRALSPYQGQIQTILAGHQQPDPAAAGEIAALLAGLALPGALIESLDQVLAGVPGLAEEPLAVRSSASDEDGDGHSLAGQYLSRLGVHGRGALHTAILDCWRAYFSANALAARVAHQHSGTPQGLALVIQPVIDAECAGACFTLDPINPASDRLVVTSGWGLGSGVADGSVPADTFWLRRKDLFIDERRVIEKPEREGLNPGGGTRKVSISTELAQAASLPDAWLKRAAEFSLAAELHFGPPQDVEWAIAAGRFWLLQSRPLTGLPDSFRKPRFALEWEEEQDRRVYWRPVPLGNGEPMLPLEVDYVDAGAAAKQEAALFSGEMNMVRVKHFNGRPYFAEVPTGLHPGDRRIRQAMLMDLNNRLRDQGMNTWDYWGPEVISAVERLAAFDLASADGPALADHLEDNLGAQRRHWQVHAQIWSPAYFALKPALAQLTGKTEDEVEPQMALLVQGEASSLTRLIDGLYRLAELARPSSRLSAFLTEPPANPLDDLSVLKTELPTKEKKLAHKFQQQVAHLLEKYGDRSGKGFGSETTFTTPTWREDPTIMFKLAALYLDPAVEPPAAARQRVRQARDALVEELRQSASDSGQLAELLRWLEGARRDAVILEDHNHYIDQFTSGQSRAAILAAGAWLVRRGDLACVEDVFWLRAAEVYETLRSPEPAQLTELVKERKSEYAHWQSLQAPPLLGLPEVQLGNRPVQAEEIKRASEGFSGEQEARSDLSRSAPANPSRLTGGRLSGLGASPGTRHGRARLVPLKVALPDLAPGDILVAQNAGPLWTPFFPILGGLVLDQGTFSQHAAATAREYGIPAVIETGNATRRIPDGARILVDGTLGIIEILDQPL